MVISRRTCDNSGVDNHSKGSSVGSHTLDLLDRDVSFEPGRAAGLSRLAEFLPRAGKDYQTYRNYDYGPGRHFNVSRLSPYLSTRLIRETEVLEATLRQYSKQEAYKFVQEIFWRGYWKGWLEQRPQLWKSYWEILPSSLEQLNEDPRAKNNYLTACLGETGIRIYDSWARELVETGYLHNHARMWFASIWIFTLKLPWELGADFFYRHLIDGDPASNTLGWRWVAGLHTKGKTYLASPSNIIKYASKRLDRSPFNSEGLDQLNTRGFPIEDVIPASSLRFTSLSHHERPEFNNSTQRCGFLINENDLSAEIPKEALHLAALGPTPRSPIGLSSIPVGDFLGQSTSQTLRSVKSSSSRHLNIETDAQSTEGVVSWATTNQLTNVVTTYAPVGPTRTALATIQRQLKQHKIPVSFIGDEYDQAVWPHTARGFFQLNREIDDILELLGLEA
ncbi:MAG: FAD-binding domain-containing protein [Candidatus Azotimanducaceae bacterium]